MIIRLGFLVAASIVAYTVKQITNTSLKSRSTLIKPSESGDESSFDDSNDHKREENGEKEELKHLQNLVNEFMERQWKLKRKLLVYYGLEEQKMEIAELKKNLKTKMVEIDKLSKTMESVKVENKTLQEEVRQCVEEKKQLEKAMTEIRNLQNNANLRKDQLAMLKGRISSVQTDEDLKKNDGGIQKKIEVGNDLELEAMELKRKHKELQLEKRILAIKVVVAEARVTDFYNMTESEMIRRIRAEANAAKLVNEDLLKQVDRLQKNRFDVVEELVYQRWVNACLRHDIQNCQTPFRKSSTGGRTSVSSRRSSTERKDVFGTTKDESSNGKKTSLVHKLKKWRRSMDSSSVVSSLKGSFGSSSESSRSRRSSNSYGSFGDSSLKNLRDRVTITAALKKSAGDSPETVSILRRRRRVSFNDSLNTTKASPDSMSASFGGIDDMYLAYKECGDKAAEMEKPVTEKTDEVRTKKYEIDEQVNSINGSPVTTQVESKAQPTDHVTESAPLLVRSHQIDINKAQPEVKHFDVIFVFFLLLGLLYFWLRNIGVY